MTAACTTNIVFLVFFNNLFYLIIGELVDKEGVVGELCDGFRKNETIRPSLHPRY
jgi:hypothetical protein